MSCSFDLVGCCVGFDANDLAAIFQATGEVTKNVTAMVEKDAAEKSDKQAQQNQLQAALAADSAYAIALARKAVFAGKDSSVEDAALRVAAQNQQEFGTDNVSARLSAARKAMSDAIAIATKTKTAYSKAMVQAWETVIQNIGAKPSAIAKADQQTMAIPREQGPSWFAKKTGPVPNWCIAAGLTATVAGIAARTFR